MAKTESKQTSKFQSGQKIKRRRVTFSIEDSAAREVILLGDFNNWNPNKHVMKSDGTGVWNKTLILAPGRYEYKFFVDGEWKTDSLNSLSCGNCFGTQNSILNVEKRE